MRTSPTRRSPSSTAMSSTLSNGSGRVRVARTSSAVWSGPAVGTSIVRWAEARLCPGGAVMTRL